MKFDFLKHVKSIVKDERAPVQGEELNYSHQKNLLYRERWQNRIRWIPRSK